MFLTICTLNPHHNSINMDRKSRWEKRLPIRETGCRVQCQSANKLSIEKKIRGKHLISAGGWVWSGSRHVQTRIFNTDHFNMSMGRRLIMVVHRMGFSLAAARSPQQGRDMQKSTSKSTKKCKLNINSFRSSSWRRAWIHFLQSPHEALEQGSDW